ncbi:MAG: TOBE domain-containing protein [Gammaproteobacteria bacterium]|nr:TOBE domain-containing protein [Gammaproteobacteria bacterium]
MRRELGMLQSRLGTTTIYVTHDQDEALSLSDRIAVMRDGKVVEIGTPHALYLAPRHLFTAEFLGQTELLPARSVTREGDTLRVETSIGTLRVANDVEEPSGRTVMIRPEHIEFAAPGDSGPNPVEGRIAQVAFTGRVVEYAVATGSTTLSVHALSGSMFDQGEAVRLRLPPERCVLVGDSNDDHDEPERGHHAARPRGES